MARSASGRLRDRRKGAGRWRLRPGCFSLHFHTTKINRIKQSLSCRESKGKTDFCPVSPRNKSTKIRRIHFWYSLKFSFLFSGEQITDSVNSKKHFYCSRSERETVAAPPRQIWKVWAVVGTPIPEGPKWVQEEKTNRRGHFGRSPLEFKGGSGRHAHRKCWHLNRHVNNFSFCGYKSLKERPTPTSSV